MGEVKSTSSSVHLLPVLTFVCLFCVFSNCFYFSGKAYLNKNKENRSKENQPWLDRLLTIIDVYCFDVCFYWWWWFA